MSSKRKHRHFIAAPIMLAGIALLYGVNAMTPVHAVLVPREDWIFTAEDKPRDFSLPNVVSGRLEPGSSVRISEKGLKIDFLKGAGHLRILGPVEISTGPDLKIMALASDISVILSDQSTTFVSISAPILVSRKEQKWILFPEQQLIFDSGQERKISVPATWLEKEKTEFMTLRQTRTSFETGLESLIGQGSYAEALAKLRSPENLKPDGTAARLLLGEVMANGGIYDNDRVSLAYTLAKFSGSDEITKLVTVRLLPEGQTVSDNAAGLVVSELKNPFVSDELLSVIPEMAAWRPKPLVAGVPDFFADTVMRISGSDPEKAFDLIHSSAKDLPRIYNEAGYPRQAEIWQSALDRLVPVISGLLKDPEKQAMLKSDQHERLISSVKEEPEQTVSSTPAELLKKSVFGHEELILKTKGMLSRGGILISTLTSLKVVDDWPDCVKVEGVYRAEKGRDVPYTFTYDVANDLLFDIIRDGVRQPNKMSADRFFKSK